jgi:predicted Rossmann fold nucleotide-binding protein DprA/Smf involved in DNA uptake
VRKTGLGPAEISQTLVELELEGRVVMRDGMYRRAS